MTGMLAGRVIVITGATRGLGLAIARRCVAEGARVGLGFRRDSGDAEALVAALNAELETAKGGAACALRLDVRDDSSVRAAVEEARGWGGEIDGWVNNAAVNHPALMVCAEDDPIEAQVETNLLGPLRCARAVLPSMMRRRRGVLLNVSSVAAVRPGRGQAVYAATKGGLESLTRALAVEYAKKGIRVLGLRPGPVKTDMLEATLALAGREVLERVPLGRLGDASEVAAHAAFLLSDRASFLTGSIHTVDGGTLCR